MFRPRNRREAADRLLSQVASGLTLLQGFGGAGIDDPEFLRQVIKARQRLDDLLLLCGPSAAKAWGETP